MRKTGPAGKESNNSVKTRRNITINETQNICGEFQFDWRVISPFPPIGGLLVCFAETARRFI